MDQPRTPTRSPARSEDGRLTLGGPQRVTLDGPRLRRPRRLVRGRVRGSLSTEWTGRGSAVKRTRLLGRESRRTTPGAALLRAHEVLGQARQPWWKSHLWLPCVSNASIGPTLPAGSGEGQLVSNKALDGETQLFQTSCRPPHGRQSRGNVARTRAALLEGPEPTLGCLCFKPATLPPCKLHVHEVY